MGSLASIESLADSQDQRILRGHDMEVSALAVSPTGKYIATGQVGTKNFKGSAAPVFLWEVDSSKRLLVLRGLTVRVNILSFSTGMYVVHVSCYVMCYVMLCIMLCALCTLYMNLKVCMHVCMYTLVGIL